MLRAKKTPCKYNPAAAAIEFQRACRPLLTTSFPRIAEYGILIFNFISSKSNFTVQKPPQIRRRIGELNAPANLETGLRLHLFSRAAGVPFGKKIASRFGENAVSAPAMVLGFDADSRRRNGGRGSGEPYHRKIRRIVMSAIFRHK